MCHHATDMAHPRTNDVTLGPQGRLVLPAPLRKALSLVAGDELIARVEGTDRIVIEKRSAGLARLQARFARTRGRKDLATELIAERRAEARRHGGQKKGAHARSNGGALR
jgi:bifunctional DNA-binding transcriptional regulator/antitoxin component of YhaV-PrlF toxin-antitoxin module